jgi:hypothetical protein
MWGYSVIVASMGKENSAIFYLHQTLTAAVATVHNLFCDLSINAILIFIHKNDLSVMSRANNS